MLGCVQEVLAPSISRAAIRLLRRHGVDVVVVKDETCCGALVHSLGKDEEARDYARRNIDAWTAVIREKPLDAIVVTTSGCGTMVKDYGSLLARDRGYAERAAYISSLARDITEFIDEIGLNPPVMWTGLKIAYHAACSLQHGQKLDALPLSLLDQAGYHILPIPEGHLCCGSAGTYNLLEPELSGQLRERKLANIAKVEPDADRHRQYRLHDAAATRHLGPVRPHHRDARLGDRRPRARGDRPAQGLGPSDRGPGRARQADRPGRLAVAPLEGGGRFGASGEGSLALHPTRSLGRRLPQGEDGANASRPSLIIDD